MCSSDLSLRDAIRITCPGDSDEFKFLQQCLGEVIDPLNSK